MKVEAEKLGLSYGGHEALTDVTFTLEPGRIHALLGRNGSGKSSLLSVLGGFRRHTAGDVRVDGRPVFENPEVTTRVGLVRDKGETITLGTAEDALYFAEWLRPTWDGDYARKLLDVFGIGIKDKVKELSTGRRSAMGVVVGLAARTQLTIFDESYLGMDVVARRQFYDLLLEDFIAHPRTIILSTHLVEEASRLFEDVLILDRGRVLLHEEADTLLARGLSVTGAREHVDTFTTGLQVLGTRDLGPTRSSFVYGDVDAARRAEAADAGLEIGPIGMQELFVHLTTGDTR